MADALENVTAHIIDMELEIDGDYNLADGVFSHMVIAVNIVELAIFTATLQEIATIHANTFNLLPRRYAGPFYSAVIDTGCACGGSGGHAQYMAYCRATRRKPTINSTRAQKVLFGTR